MMAEQSKCPDCGESIPDAHLLLQAAQHQNILKQCECENCGHVFWHSTAVKTSYEGGKCPECGELIPDNATDGCECNCGMTFWH